MRTSLGEFSISVVNVNNGVVEVHTSVPLNSEGEQLIRELAKKGDTGIEDATVVGNKIVVEIAANTDAETMKRLTRNFINRVKTRAEGFDEMEVRFYTDRVNILEQAERDFVATYRDEWSSI